MLIDLDRTKQVLPEFDKYKGSGALDLYLLAQSEGMSVSAFMEKLDPTELDESGQAIQGCDAFTRHLMALDIRLHGRNQATIAELMDSGTTYLMPEMVRREIEAGMNVAAKFSYKDCVAVTVPSKTSNYHPLYIPDLDLATAHQRRTKAMGARAASGRGGEFPRVSIRKREKDIVIQDEGRIIETAYNVIRDYGWQDFAVFLRLVGAQIAYDKLYEIYDLGVNGDGTVGAATDTFNGVAGTLVYTDLVHLHTNFNAPFNMDRILAPGTSFETILALAQFQDPMAGWQFQKTGEVVTPMGARMKQINAVPGGTPTGTVMVSLDSRFAVKEVISQELSVEADKIISRRFEEAVASEESAFCVLADGALRRTVWT